MGEEAKHTLPGGRTSGKARHIREHQRFFETKVPYRDMEIP